MNIFMAGVILSSQAWLGNAPLVALTSGNSGGWSYATAYLQVTWQVQDLCLHFFWQFFSSQHQLARCQMSKKRAVTSQDVGSCDGTDL